METFAYLQAAVAYEAPESVDRVPMSGEDDLLQGLNWRKMPAQTATSLLAIACSLSILGAAGNALALQRNDSGTAVVTLQNDLSRTGYYVGPVTGFYGELTEASILRFQRENGLTPDGVAGAATLEALRNRPTTQPTAQAQALSTPASTANSLLQRGDQGPAVADLQTRLQSAGFFDGPVTGFYGQLTETAVLQFQQNRQLTVDGRAGAATLAALRQAPAAPVRPPTSAVNPPSAAPTPAPTTPTTVSTPGILQRGDRGAAVADLQNRLRNAGYFEGPMTGFFGGLTEEAVIRFQQARQLTADGTVGPATLAALNQVVSSAQRATTTSQNNAAILVTSPPTTSTVMQRGDRGTAVADLQNRLRNSGYFDGPMTGFYGRLTEAAVTKFQQAKGLTADGKAGLATLTALRQTTQQPSTPSGQGGPATPVASTTDILQRGDRGLAVADLQNRLKAAGYFEGPMTGFYGRLTEAAVVKFQQAKGLTADGKAGPSTVVALRQTSRSQTPSPSPQAQTPSPSPQVQTPSPSPQVQTPSPSPQVQTPSPSPQSQPPSPSPQSQAPNPSPQTQRLTTSPQAPSPRPIDGTLQRGDSGPAVAELQASLKRTGYLKGQVTGFFGDLTQESVTKFQQAKGLSADGKAGPATLEALRKAPAASSPSS